MPENEKSGGKGILIIGGLIISGIIIALMLKAKPVQSTPSLPGDLITIQQMQERVAYLEQQIKVTSFLLTPLEPIQSQVLEPRGGPGSEGFGFPLPTEEQSPSPASRNLIHYKDGSVTDADVMQGEKYKNKESWSIKRDADGAITGIEVERNASVGNSQSPPD